jgi:hypothetical protein
MLVDDAFGLSTSHGNQHLFLVPVSRGTGGHWSHGDGMHQALIDHAEGAERSSGLSYMNIVGHTEDLRCYVLYCPPASRANNDLAELKVRREVQVVETGIFVLIFQMRDNPPLMFVFPLLKLGGDHLIDHILVNGRLKSRHI